VKVGQDHRTLLNEDELGLTDTFGIRKTDRYKTMNEQGRRRVGSEGQKEEVSYASRNTYSKASAAKATP
jgi:hypothetical protein